MAARVPDINPLRFYREADAPDYLTRWPNDYNTLQREDYYPGINATKFFKDFVVNHEISLQFAVSTPINQTISIFKLDENKVFQNDGVLTPINITPTGFVSETVYKYSFTPSSGGVYYLDFSSEGFRSDIFIAHSEEKFKKRLVEIEYWNSYNDFNSVFFDGTTNIYKGKTFFEGRLIPGDPQNEISGFTSDRGSFTKTRSTPVEVALLKLLKVHMTYQRNLHKIFSCDNIYINGRRFNNEEPFTKEQIEFSDLSNYEINLKEVDITYSYKF